MRPTLWLLVGLLVGLCLGCGRGKEPDKSTTLPGPDDKLTLPKRDSKRR